MDLIKIAKDRIKEIGGFITANNYEILSVLDGYCELEGHITETSVNHLNKPHGGYIFGLADTAAGIAAMTTGNNLVTINSSIDYLRLAKGNKLKAIAKCIKKGKTISFFEVYIYDEEENLIAKANINYSCM